MQINWYAESAGKATDPVLEISRVGLTGEGPSFEQLGGQAAREKAAEGLPYNISGFGGGLDQHGHQVEGLLIQMNGSTIRRLKPLQTVHRSALPNVR
jgi:hypothetical protein